MESTQQSPPPSPPPSPSPRQITGDPNKPPPISQRPPRESIQRVNGDRVVMRLHLEIQPSAARKLQL